MQQSLRPTIVEPQPSSSSSASCNCKICLTEGSDPMSQGRGQELRSLSEGTALRAAMEVLLTRLLVSGVKAMEEANLLLIVLVQDL